MGQASIYGLYDREGNLRYIGKANDPRQRLMGHMRNAKQGRTPVYDWIRKHGKPEMRILIENSIDWREDERRLISHARERGERLLNLADGGDEPFCSLEVRRANAKKLSQHPNTIKQRRINGQKTFANIRKGLKPDGSYYTRAEIIIDAYEWVLRHSLDIGAIGLAKKVARKMSGRYAECPATYSRWKDLEDVSWLGQA